MLLDLLIFTVGLVVLYFGADWLIRGAAGLALRFGIRPLVVGLTVIALGTSMPEFLINFFAAMSGESGLALGNIVGSNITNIALILGLSAVVFPVAVARDTLRREYPMMMGVMILFYLLALDGVVGKRDGLILVLVLVAFLIYIVMDARRRGGSTDIEDIPASGPDAVVLPVWKKAMYLAGGMVLLSVGARLMVQSAVSMAARFDIEPVVVGLTIVAVGTSLPELAASVVCAIKKEADMSVGNILGSNLLNVLFVVGLVSLIRPLAVDPISIQVHFPVMLVFSLVLLPLAWTNFSISRIEGVFLLVSFVGYLGWLVYPYL